MTDDHNSIAGPADVHPALRWYATQPWARALVQAIPVAGGSLDTVLAWRGTVLAQERLEELLRDVSSRVEHLEGNESRDAFLQSEEFVALFETTAASVARTTSAAKRQRAAEFLAGQILHAEAPDLSQQIATDLGVLEDYHFAVLRTFPHGAGVRPYLAERAYVGISAALFDKAIADLARFGFIRPDGVDPAGNAAWAMTEYSCAFRRAVTG